MSAPTIPMAPVRRSAEEKHTQTLLQRWQVDEIAAERGLPERTVDLLLRLDGVRKQLPGRKRPLYVRQQVLAVFGV